MTTSDLHKTKPYYGWFDNWASVQSNYNMNEAEPDEVHLADYEDWPDIGYNGDSMVIYRRGSKWYLNMGGHCSCYGLEDQWSPDEYDTLEQAIRGIGVSGYAFSRYNKLMGTNHVES